MGRLYAFTVAYLLIFEHWTRSEYCPELKKFLMKAPFVVCILYHLVDIASQVFLFSDLMWSDPDDIDNWAVSPRGAGWLFGGNVTREVSFHFRSGETSADSGNIV